MSEKNNSIQGDLLEAKEPPSLIFVFMVGVLLTLVASHLLISLWPEAMLLPSVKRKVSEAAYQKAMSDANRLVEASTVDTWNLAFSQGKAQGQIEGRLDREDFPEIRVPSGVLRIQVTVKQPQTPELIGWGAPVEIRPIPEKEYYPGPGWEGSRLGQIFIDSSAPDIVDTGSFKLRLTPGESGGYLEVPPGAILMEINQDPAVQAWRDSVQRLINSGDINLPGLGVYRGNAVPPGDTVRCATPVPKKKRGNNGFRKDRST